MFQGKLLSLSNLFLNDFFSLIYFNFFIKNLNIFVGSSFLNRYDTNSLFRSIFYFLNILGLNVNNLHVVVSHIGKLSLFEVGLIKDNLPNKNSVNKQSFLYLCGVDLDKFLDSFLLNIKFIVFQGSFFNQRIYDYVNLILPTTVYTEDIFHYLIWRVVIELQQILYLVILMLNLILIFLNIFIIQVFRLLYLIFLFYLIQN